MLKRRKKLRLKRTPGQGRGKGLGIPTLNFVVPEGLDLERGVYAGWLHVGKQKFPSAIHFGPRPVFGEETETLEAHILGESLPHAEMKRGDLEFVAYIRPVQNFPTPQAMVREIKKDVAKIEKILQ